MSNKHTCNEQQRQKSKKLLLKICSNILSNPNTERYQRLNHQKISDKLSACDACISLLIHYGFHHDVNINKLIFDSSKITDLELMKNMILSCSIFNYNEAVVQQLVDSDLGTREECIKASSKVVDCNDIQQVAEQLLLEADNAHIAQQWQCAACTLYNDMDKTICIVCDAPNPNLNDDDSLKGNIIQKPLHNFMNIIDVDDDDDDDDDDDVDDDDDGDEEKFDLRIYQNMNKGDDSCDGKDIKKCIAFKRMTNALANYSRFDLERNKNDQMIFTNFAKEVYQDEILDDYIHIMEKHNDPLQIYEMKELLIKSNMFEQCDLSQCEFTKRHHMHDAEKHKNTLDPFVNVVKERLDSFHFNLFHLYEPDSYDSQHELHEQPPIKCVESLKDHHKLINITHCNDIFDLLEASNTLFPVVSYILDTYGLIRYRRSIFQSKDNDYSRGFRMITEHYYQSIIKVNTDISYRYEEKKFKIIYEQYRKSFGDRMTLKDPNIKIKIRDSMFIFMSYIFGMNIAIRQYITPEPLQCPLMIDLWIIPNRTMMLEKEEMSMEEVMDTMHKLSPKKFQKTFNEPFSDSAHETSAEFRVKPPDSNPQATKKEQLQWKETDNNIGNIKQRLDQNKLVYIKRKCNAYDIVAFANQIRNCLSATKVKKAMDNRLIFIVDRRYKTRDSDSLYCIVPPAEYAPFTTHSSHDVLNISYWYCSSNYLLPRAPAHNRGSGANIGSTTHLNGYMFNLSYLIYKHLPINDKTGKIQNHVQNEEKEANPVLSNGEYFGADKYNLYECVLPKKISECSVNQLVFIMNERLIPKIPMLVQYKSIIETYFIANNICGDVFLYINHDKFVEELIAETSDHEIKKSLYTLYSSIRDYNFAANTYVSTRDHDDIASDNYKRLEIIQDKQRSTISVKIMLSTQGKSVRFVPHQITNMFPKYFMTNDYNQQDLSQIVSTLFSLNLYDPYLYLNHNKALSKITEAMDLQSLLGINQAPTDDIIQQNETRLYEQCKSWKKVFCQRKLASKKINHQLLLLKERMDLNINIDSLWSTNIEQNEAEYMSVESKDYHKPHMISCEITDYFPMSVYDSIIWNKAQNNTRVNGQIDIQRYIDSNMDLSELVQLVPISTVIQLEADFNGMSFLENNSSLLIDDGIVPYAYYLSIFSHIIKHMTNMGNLQLCLTFVTPHIVSTAGDVIDPNELQLNIKQSSLRKLQFDGQQSLQSDINKMMRFIYDTIKMKVENSRIHIIIDRRETNINSTEATVYGNVTYTKDGAIQSLISDMNSSAINILTNPHFFHVNFYHFQQNEIMAYFVRNKCCIRFFPELMMEIWPNIFYGDSNFIRNTVHDHQFRHSFAVALRDEQFTKTYYWLFNRKFISINYYRSERRNTEEHYIKEPNTTMSPEPLFNDELNNHLKTEPNLQFLIRWLDDNEYDSDAIQDDIYEICDAFEDVPIENIQIESSNIALFTQSLDDIEFLSSIIKYPVYQADLKEFHRLLQCHKCDWTNDKDLSHKHLHIEACDVEQLIQRLDRNIFDEINDDNLYENKHKILQCFKQQNIDGHTLKSMTCDEFVSTVSTYCDSITNLKQLLEPLYYTLRNLIKVELLTKKALTSCAIIDKISFIAFKYNKHGDKNNILLDVFNEAGYTISDFMNDISHLFRYHQFMTNDLAYAWIKEAMINKNPSSQKMCYNVDCYSMQRFCRKQRFEPTKLKQKKKMNKDREIATWLILLDQIHCPFFHDKSTDFRNRYKPLKQDIFTESNEENKSDAFPELQFGVSVDEWLSFGDKPTFECMEEEVLCNDYSPICEDTLESMKHELYHRHTSHTNDQHLNENELLALKLFTDQDNLQKEFCKSFLKVPEHADESLVIRRHQFYHWANMLRRAFKYAHVPINKPIYRGLTQILQLPSFQPFCGKPTSTTTDWNVAHTFSQSKGLILYSDPNEMVYGLDVSFISIYANETEIWLYDQLLPLQKAAIMLHDEKIKIEFIASHLINIQQPLTSIHQFLGPNESDASSYIMKMMQNKNLLSTVTKYQHMNIFERLFFEFEQYSLESSPLDCFENLIGNVTLEYSESYFYIHGVRDIISELFIPTSFRILYSNNSNEWKQYDANVRKLTNTAKHLLRVETNTLKYRFTATFCNEDEIQRMLLSKQNKIHLLQNDVEMIQKRLNDSTTKIIEENGKKRTDWTIVDNFLRNVKNVTDTSYVWSVMGRLGGM